MCPCGIQLSYHAKPFNFTKIDINVSGIENVFENYEENVQF